MTKPIVFLVVFVLLSVLWYLAIAFVSWTFPLAPSTWGGVERGFYLFFHVLWAFFALIIAYDWGDL